MRAKFTFFVLSLVGLFLLGSVKAFACMCKPSESPSYAFQQAHAVFTGTVVEIIKPVYEKSETRSYKPTKIRFKVQEALKNVPGEEITITESGACDFHFQVNESYLVYSDLRNGNYVAHSCGGTTYLSIAKYELQCARNEKNRNQVISIFGRTNHYDRYSGKGLKIPLPEKIKIALSNGKERREVSVDEEGFYILDDLGLGEQKIELILPAELTTDFGSRTFNIKESACFKQDFIVNINGTISGRITNADGTPSANVSVSFSLKQNVAHKYDTQTDKDGRYSLRGIPPGEYILAARRSEMTATGTFVNPHFLYFPKTKDFAEAALIKLGYAEELSNLDLQFPADFDADIQPK
jgi:hypothetical protein